MLLQIAAYSPALFCGVLLFFALHFPQTSQSCFWSLCLWDGGDTPFRSPTEPWPRAACGVEVGDTSAPQEPRRKDGAQDGAQAGPQGSDIPHWLTPPSVHGQRPCRSAQRADQVRGACCHPTASQKRDGAFLMSQVCSWQDSLDTRDCNHGRACHWDGSHGSPVHQKDCEPSTIGSLGCCASGRPPECGTHVPAQNKTRGGGDVAGSQAQPCVLICLCYCPEHREAASRP